MTTAQDRRSRAAAEAEAAVAAESAEATARREDKAAKRRTVRSRVELMEARIASGDLIPTSEEMAELDADREEAGIGRRPIPGMRMADRDVVTLAAHAARRALDVEIRAGWRISYGQRKYLMPEIASTVAAAVMALSDGAQTPAWKDAPIPTGASDRAAYDSARVDIRARWRAALLPIARAIVWEHRQEDEGKRAARAPQTPQEAGERTAAHIYAHALDVVEEAAQHLAAARPLTDRERTGMAAALTDGEKLTAADRAAIDGRTPGGQRVAESKGRAALRTRWTTVEDFRADFRAAERAQRDALETLFEDTHTDDEVRHLADLFAACEWIKAAAALQSSKPARRISSRALPTIDKRADRYATPTTTDHEHGTPVEREQDTDDTVAAILTRQNYRRARLAWRTGPDLTPRPMLTYCKADDPAHVAREIEKGQAELTAHRAQLIAAREVWGGRLNG
jgi:hypothetical protein